MVFKGIFEHNGIKYSKLDIIESLQKLQINKGDIIFIHSDVGVFGKLADIKDRKEFNKNILEACLDTVGNEGTVIIPTFTYSFCKKGIFDINNTPSELNYFTEVARQTKGFERSDDPIFSIVAHGPESDYFTKKLSTECLGLGSVWDKMYKKNVVNVMLGIKFDSTFIHYIETIFQVPYRYDKKFSGIIKKGKQEYEKVYSYFVRDLEINVEPHLEEFYEKALNQKILRETVLGAGNLMAIKSKELFDLGTKMLKNDPYSLVKIKK